MTRDRERRALLVGAGGIGVSALAQMLAADGWRVEGTDRTRSEITDVLTARGIPVSITEQPILPVDTELLVYSDAVSWDALRRQAVAERGVRAVSYAEYLGECLASRQTIAIAGSHGKSTTTALVGLLLEAAGCDPCVVVGTRVPQWSQHGVGNFRPGKGTLAVVEADEYRRHFLTLTPTVAVVTSVDHDHVDAFPTPDDYRSAFRDFRDRVRAGGTLVLRANEPMIDALRFSRANGRWLVTFGIGVPADVAANVPEVRGGRQEFQLSVHGESWGNFSLAVPGVYVVANAAAAVAAALPFGITPGVVRHVLAEFRGTWRRFERVGELNGVPVISDYAHHPTELRALAAAARQWYPRERLVIAFQPHQRARTMAFSPQFIAALQEFDDIILAEVFDVAGREEEPPVSTRPWVEALSVAGKSVTYAPELADAEQALRERARADSVLLVVGAGDIDQVARRIAAP